MKLFSMFAGALALAIVGGCGPFWVNPYITVEESKLNRVEIHYYKLDKKPIYRTSVYIDGGGYVLLKKGTSELISNDFAKHSDSEGWENIKTQRVHVDPKHVNDIFQALVNEGLLDGEKLFKSAKEPRKDRVLGVNARINGQAYNQQANIFEVNPDLAEILLDVVREFDNPTLR